MLLDILDNTSRLSEMIHYNDFISLSVSPSAVQEDARRTLTKRFHHYRLLVLILVRRPAIIGRGERRRSSAVQFLPTTVVPVLRIRIFFVVLGSQPTRIAVTSLFFLFLKFKKAVVSNPPSGH